jgi:hypothetical protein
MVIIHYYYYLYNDLCWFTLFFIYQVIIWHLKWGLMGLKQVEESPSATKSIIESKRAHKGVAMARFGGW